MVQNSSATVIFVDCCMSVAKRMFTVAAIVECLRDLDEMSATAGENDEGATFANPFDSHTRLQAVMDKCKASQPAALQWATQGIWYGFRKGIYKAMMALDLTPRLTC